MELIGKFDSKYRHDISSLAMQSYSQIGAFPHAYHIDGLPCQTHVEWFAGGTYTPRSITMVSQQWNLTARGFTWPQSQSQVV